MRRRTWILAAMLLALPACADGTTTETETTIVGTYSIQSVDGHSLPYNNNGEILTAGTLQLKADNTWTVTFFAHFVNGGNDDFTNHGTYTYLNGDLAMKSADDGSTTHGTISGTTMTVNGDDGVYILKKN